jgi:hypothetical protein
VTHYPKSGHKRVRFGVGVWRCDADNITHAHNLYDALVLVDVHRIIRKDNIRCGTANCAGRAVALFSSEAFGEVVAQELGDISPQNLIAVGIQMNVVGLKKRDERLFIWPKEIRI